MCYSTQSTPIKSTPDIHMLHVHVRAALGTQLLNFCEEVFCHQKSNQEIHKNTVQKIQMVVLADARQNGSYCSAGQNTFSLVEVYGQHLGHIDPRRTIFTCYNGIYSLMIRQKSHL